MASIDNSEEQAQQHRTTCYSRWWALFLSSISRSSPTIVRNEGFYRTDPRKLHFFWRMSLAKCEMVGDNVVES